MRAFCLIFIVQVLIFLAQPCEEVFPDSIDRDDRARAVCFELISRDEQPLEECSPFCLCPCCSHPVVQRQSDFSILKNPESQPLKVDLAEYGNTPVSAGASSIWQPPKA